MIEFIHTEKSLWLFRTGASRTQFELSPPLAEGMVAINSMPSNISYKSPVSA